MDWTPFMWKAPKFKVGKHGEHRLHRVHPCVTAGNVDFQNEGGSSVMMGNPIWRRNELGNF